MSSHQTTIVLSKHKLDSSFQLHIIKVLPKKEKHSLFLMLLMGVLTPGSLHTRPLTLHSTNLFQMMHMTAKYQESLFGQS